MEQRSQEWHDMRKNMIGASDVPVIMGVSPWKTPYQLWLEKVGLRQPEPTNYAQQRGIDNEAQALQKFIEEYGIEPFVPQVVTKDDWAMASFDGLTFDRSKGVEIKCPGKVDHELALSGQVPEKYYPQLQFQMYVADLKEVSYFSYVSDDDAINLKVERDDAYISEMLSKCRAFLNYMRESVPPALSARDIVQREDDAWLLITEQYKAANAVLKEAEEVYKKAEAEEARLKQALICMSGGFNTEGNGIKLTRIVTKGRVDYKAIPELENVDLEKYRKEPSESWRVYAR